MPSLRFGTAVLALSLAVPSFPAFAQEEGEGETITILERAPAESASSVHLGTEDLLRRPHQNASDLLRQTPGLMVTQHAGGGKADQLFLRGFDADHGTDIAVYVDGVPVNLTSHGHGQGYADTHWVIPETVAAIDVHKGPYGARFGDFYTAGAVEMTTLDDIAGWRLALTSGTELAGPVSFDDPTFRLVAMGSPRLGAGKTLLAAELGYTNGPFLDPQRFRRGNLYGKWRGPLGGGELTVAGTFYAAGWNQSGQIPERAVDSGELDRFGAVDPTEGGDSSRASLSAAFTAGHSRGAWNARLYVVDYRLQLFSNFTLFARDPVDGDQIEQNDGRTTVGANGSYSVRHDLGGMGGFLLAGLQARGDRVTADLWHTAARERLADCFAEGGNPCNRVRSHIGNLAAFVEENLDVTSWLHVIAGARLDLFAWDVEDLDPETAIGGSAQKLMVSPKLSAIVKPSARVDLFVNAGFGFHSNDARAAVAGRGRGALARAFGAETGARMRPTDGFSAAVAAWYLGLASEQVWSGDAGGTEASDPTRRYGLDLDLRWDLTPWLRLDGNVNLARSRFVANAGNAGAVALAPRILGGGGVTFHRGPTSVALRARAVGSRPANEDETLTAEGFVVADLVASHRMGKLTLELTALNLTNTDWREAQFAEESRLRSEPTPVEDVHFTPGTPFAAFATLQVDL
jgi:hypothetical protein